MFFVLCLVAKRQCFRNSKYPNRKGKEYCSNVTLCSIERLYIYMPIYIQFKNIYKNYVCSFLLFQPIDESDNQFWDQFWCDNVLNVQDIFTLIPALEIRTLREEAPANLSTLVTKAIEKIIKAVDNSCRIQQEQQSGTNMV